MFPLLLEKLSKLAKRCAGDLGVNLSTGNELIALQCDAGDE